MAPLKSCVATPTGCTAPATPHPSARLTGFARLSTTMAIRVSIRTSPASEIAASRYGFRSRARSGARRTEKGALNMSRTIASVTFLFAAMAAVTGWAEPTPALAFTPAKLNLGYQLVGTSGSAVPDQLQNMGAVPLLISAIETHGDDA